MRKLIAVAACVIALSALTPPAQQQTVAPAAGTTNPLIAPWTGPYGGVPPWDQARAQFFPAAFEAALAQQRAEIEAIVANPAPPDFNNTIAAMQRAGQTLDRVGRMFGVMTDNMSTPEFQKLDHEWQPKLAAAADAIAFNPGLFKRIEAVYAFQAAARTNLPAGAAAPHRAHLRQLRAARGAARRRGESAPFGIQSVAGRPVFGVQRQRAGR